MSQSAERAGKPDVGELVRQGRLKYNGTRGLDPNPNPPIGAVPNPETGMRAGMTPEKYHKLVLLSERRRRLGKEWDFVPVLEDHEFDIYLAWLKSGGPKKMKASGNEASRAQAENVLALIEKYDPQNAARLAAIPTHPKAQLRDAIGGTNAAEDVEAAAQDVELDDAPAEEVVDATEDEEAPADLAPEAIPAADSPPEAPGYEGVNADQEDTPPEVVSAPAPKKRGPKSKK